MNPGENAHFPQVCWEPKVSTINSFFFVWSHVGPFLVSFRYTMGLELTFHNFHIHIRALDTRGILLKNMVYHANNKHIFFGPAHPSPLSILLKHLHPSHCAHGVTKQLVLRLCCAPINIITAPCMYMHGFTLVYIYIYTRINGPRIRAAIDSSLDLDPLQPRLQHMCKFFTIVT